MIKNTKFIAATALAIAMSHSIAAQGNNAAMPLCGTDYTAISQIQGTGDNSPLLGSEVEVEAVVTADFQAGLNGFYLQSAAGDEDTDSNSSEGIFVFTGDNPIALTVGGRVRLAGSVNEFEGMTQISDLTGITTCAGVATPPQPVPLNLPFEKLPEHLEGMLVSFSGLTVNGTFQLGRHGSVALAEGRRMTPTQIAKPGAAANAVAAKNALNEIYLDDGSKQQNPAHIPFPPGGLSAGNSLRVGDTMSLSKGVLHQSQNRYSVQPIAGVSVVKSNPRTESPELKAGANLVVASFNVLNYFTTLEERGADSEIEFQRQEAKIVSAIKAMDAHIIGLMELENNGFGEDSAIATLVKALNTSVEKGTWQYIDPKVPNMGTASIKVGTIYRSDLVAPVGDAKILNSSNSITDDAGNPLFVERKSRPMLVQEFRLTENGQNLVVAVNHLKSKGSSCEDLNDPNLGDGQGNCNVTRTRAAKAIGSFLDSEYTGKPTLIIGDLNAYAKEDPLTALADAGYTELFEHLGKENAYGYVFRGRSGQLDHALANAALLDAVVDVVEWNINADEPVILDYNTEFKSEQQIQSYYAADPFRSSDHDPVIVALNLQAKETDKKGSSMGIVFLVAAGFLGWSRRRCK